MDVVVAVIDCFNVIVVVVDCYWSLWHGGGCCWLLLTALRWLWFLLSVIDRFDVVVVVDDCYWSLWHRCGCCWLLLTALTWLWLLLTVIDCFDVVVVVAVIDRFDVVVVVADCYWPLWRGCGCCWLLLTALTWLRLLLTVIDCFDVAVVVAVIDRFDVVVFVVDCHRPLWRGCGCCWLLLTALAWLRLLLTVLWPEPWASQLIIFDLMSRVSNWLRNILTGWFVLRWPYTADGILNPEAYTTLFLFSRLKIGEFSSVQFSPSTEWVVAGTWRTIQQRTYSSFFCRRLWWAVLA